MPRSLRLAALALFALACHRTPSPEPAPEQAGPPSPSVGLVRGENELLGLAPDPEQIAAGVPHLRFQVEVGDSPSRGRADAPVTIVMFSDFECPYCADALATIAELEREYDGQIRFVYKGLPLDTHPYAMLAALVGYSAQREGKFWPYHDRLFSGASIDQATIVRYAEESGLDLEQVAVEVEALTAAPQIRADLRVAKRLKVNSTPEFFINGRRLPGARPKHIFRQIIDQELDLAKQLRTAGIPDGELYAHMTQWGYTTIQYVDDPPELDEDTVYPVPVGDSPARGPVDAPITIVAFSDFQCPYCARGDETMRELQSRYGDQIRFVFKHFPLPGHPKGALASRASFAAAKVGKFWEFHDAVFDRGARFDAEDLVEIGASLGIDPDTLQTVMASEANDPPIERDIELGMRLGVTGTPAYFINGRPIVGAHPEVDFRMLIVEELGRVEQARKQGIAAKDVYRHLTGAPE